MLKFKGFLHNNQRTQGTIRRYLVFMKHLILPLLIIAFNSGQGQTLKVEGKIQIVETPAQKLVNRSNQIEQLKLARANALQTEISNRIAIEEYNRNYAERVNRNPELLFLQSKRTKLKSKNLTIGSTMEIPNWWTKEENMAFVNLEDGTHFNVQVWESALSDELKWVGVKSVNDLIKSSSKQKPEGSLGFYYYGAQDSLLKFNGMYIHTVLDGRTADRIGLMPGDVIYRINDQPIETSKPLIYSPFSPADTLTIEFGRASDTLVAFGIAAKTFNANSSTIVDNHPSYTVGQEFVYNDLGKLRAGTLFTVRVPIEDANKLLNFSFNMLSAGEYVDHDLELDRFRRLISLILNSVSISNK